MIDRIRKVIDYSQLSPAVFADTIGISRSGMTHLLSGRNQPSLDVARKILQKYPEISTEWLIMGMGDMLRLDDATAMPQRDDLPVAEPVPEQPVENAVNDRQTDLFGEYEIPDDSEAEEVLEVPETANLSFEEAPESEVVTDPVPEVRPQPAVQTRPSVSAVTRKVVEPKPVQTPAPVKRERRTVVPQERKLQKIVFFYDDHSFEVYGG